uniref:alpha-1,2-Mannosidase n=1 Tax=Fagus sylvatica TaxID=28930 RepID=A0A2N9FLF9_FAGSY
MLPRKFIGAWMLVFLVIFPNIFNLCTSQLEPRWGVKKRHVMREKVRKMFYHAYDNYMNYAFPHDELKPITKSFTDSLSELGNLKLEHLPQHYKGSALTLIESLSSLLILGNSTEFERAVLWLSDNLTFDVDARVNLFECNIRVLGGLVSAHILATDSTNRLVHGVYENQLLILAEELGKRFLPAFNTPTGLPYAWINLKYGVMVDETTETSTSGCGSLILEMGALSRLTGDPTYESVAIRALRKLWSMRSSLNLLGTTLDVVLVGDIAAANSSHREFFHVWEKFGVLPERYLLDHQMLHPTEKYYPLRPELAESTFYLYQATKDSWYLKVGESIVNSLNLYTKVEGGYASIKDVTTKRLEDHQHSFFLAETCKYLYLLFDDSFLVDRNYIFTTEGHPLPVLSDWHERLPDTYIPTNWSFAQVMEFLLVQSEKQARRASAMSLQVCPATTKVNSGGHDNQQVESACHIHDARADHRCFTDEDCGVDSTTCRRRSCSMAGYCGLWLLI